MRTNIIRAIINLVNNPLVELKDFYESRNRANSAGDALEEYVKDLFAGTISEMDATARNRIMSQCFSYLGNQNNPPDAIIRGGDAIEVKKIETFTSDLALNSSYPKHKLYSNSTMITRACRECEEWEEKDIVYVVGTVNKKTNNLHSLCMVYGVDYSASEEVYLRVKNAISSGILEIPNIEFSETNELGRVNRVDPLGITNLRIRGMWTITNPLNVFDYVYRRDTSKDFNFMALINSEKYDTLEYTGELELLVEQFEGLEIEDVEIKNPDNPAQLKQAKLITFKK